MKYKVLKSLIVICLLTVQISLDAQEKVGKSSRIGVTFSSFGANDIFGKTGTHNYLYESSGFYTIGVGYLVKLNKWLEVEVDAEYSRHTVNIAPNIFPGTDVFGAERTTKLSLLDIPATLRANFLKYFFVNGGLLIDIDFSANMYVDNQTGVGGIVGFGANYDFGCGISAFLNPYIKAHSWITSGDRQKILEKGIRLGICYDLRKIVKR
jgi:hypothetical protein